MKVLKFGGTSVGSVENMRAVMKIIADGDRKVVVLSAMSGTTNTLVEISDYLYKRNKEAALGVISGLEKKYYNVVYDLFGKNENKEKGKKILETHFEKLKSFTLGDFNEVGERTILAQGELLSTNLFTILMQENGYNACCLPALDFMKIDKDKSPDTTYIRTHLAELMENSPKADYYITQGFICRNPEGEIDNLQRGGSDYSASLIGAAIKSEEVQIWTDIDGFHNNDPRFVENTHRVDFLSFNEAAELAYFGAKILHPQTIHPAMINNIPVRLKNTMAPESQGTLITAESSGPGIKAVAAKDGITAIKIRSGRMLNAYGFLKNVFEIFEFFKTPIDMITTSEVAVSLTIDNDHHLHEILKELREYGEVIVDEKQTIVCIVGDIVAGEKGYAARVFKALEGISVRMISYGGSRHNISVLVNTRDKQATLEALSDKVLNV
ncbi:aspartate kinase [Prolixibacter sp. SD074]|uniref:aspartate kinase n=1 Tax=Prolixibacter sp. SD074 TaxID=2652391 RepID=UPI00127D3DA8|nr:aspartate kinase [Prolixibacter sp. SD074]GET29953.1 aspartokinase [Prolixibacter sp. SD074]